MIEPIVRIGRHAIGNQTMSEDEGSKSRLVGDAPRKPLPPAALRALAEAERRRQAAAPTAARAAKELQGPEGPEPTRYGDWERKGIASDF